MSKPRLRQSFLLSWKNGGACAGPSYKTNPCRIAANLPEKRPGITCDTCRQEIPHQTFRFHLQRHECALKEKSLLCPIPGCPERYALKQSMENHLAIHGFHSAAKSKQECSVCQEMIKVEEIADHLKEAHQVDPVIPCRRCLFKFHDWEPLLDHLNEHRYGSRLGIGGGGFHCDLCVGSTVKFLRYEDLRGHFFNVHKIGKKFLCESCELEFFSRQALSSHQRSHGQQSTEKVPKKQYKYTYKCDLCPGLVLEAHTLFSHKIQEHGAPPTPCKYCGEPFTSFDKLRKHERAHIAPSKTYKCSVENCGRVFKSKTKWTYHERGAHRDPMAPKLFVCEACGKGFNIPYLLQAHVRQVHSERKEPRRVCETCGESFANANTLRKHNLIHSGERPHPCPNCGQAFRHRSVMLTHLKSHEKKGDSFKPNGPMKKVRKRVGKDT